MATETDIANMALAHLKAGKRIGNLRTEKSAEAMFCLTFFDNTRQEVLRDFDWPFATLIAPLALVAQNPNNEWGYSYRYPSGCLNFRKIQSGIRVMSNFSAIAFRIGADVSGKLVWTDQGTAIGEWTQDITDTSQYHPDFVTALSLKLATYIAPAVTGSDPYKLGDRAEQRYAQSILKSMTNAANEQRQDPPTDADAILARGGGSTPPYPKAY